MNKKSFLSVLLFVMLVGFSFGITMVDNASADYADCCYRVCCSGDMVGGYYNKDELRCEPVGPTHPCYTLTCNCN